MPTTLTRTVRFHARHSYGRPEWTAEENRSAFGSNVQSHAHDYVVEVSVRGEVDPQTGFLVDLGALDDLLEREIRRPLDGRNLNEVVPEFRSGDVQPSTEALARLFWERMEDHIPGAATLEAVRVAESRDLASEVRRAP